MFAWPQVIKSEFLNDLEQMAKKTQYAWKQLTLENGRHNDEVPNMDELIRATDVFTSKII